MAVGDHSEGDVKPHHTRITCAPLPSAQVLRGSGAAPGKLAFTFTAAPKANGSSSSNGSSNGSGSSSSDDSSWEQKLSEAERDAKLKLLKEVQTDSEEGAAFYATLLASLRAAHPGHLPLLLEHMRKLAGVWELCAADACVCSCG